MPSETVAASTDDARASANGDGYNVQSVKSALKGVNQMVQHLHEIECLGGSKGFNKWLAEAKPLPMHVDTGTFTQYMPCNVTVEGSVLHTSFQVSSGFGVP
ncbi:hypothetical protein PUNSTDRAFT_131958 [Punctularia strigosozonata HHB-11173 SS5]|uniref:uncharacterized protein n=1 Tax=Punctularia strigosozonata (strain HHB-11173) TaxID=741275 RepID=UPI0004417A13|nr:uncharacterized protein PUNSTDRAFT_131958 [Punctularia strigosozonata HHB-11173 SS5]EIN11803.1 hypothetical protein PUNSTDRAFT_131958 [Punctularia strigosozonata HHB-11173 SS5]